MTTSSNSSIKASKEARNPNTIDVSDSDNSISDDDYGVEPSKVRGKVKSSRKLQEKLDKFGLGYMPSRQDLELLRLQKERVTA